MTNERLLEPHHQPFTWNSAKRNRAAGCVVLRMKLSRLARRRVRITGAATHRHRQRTDPDPSYKYGVDVA